ncbi:MAG TPA: translocation/assembly module TamB domain-containing protein [Bdellovibrionota bacterium]|nr:translocation/assembly module TamB domain-containing protein [Bdellovibrionota bacterium]
MKERKRKALRVVLILAVIFFTALALAWRPLLDIVLRETLVDQLSNRLKAEVKIGSIDVTFFPPAMVAEKITLERSSGPLRYISVSRASIQPGTGPIFLGKVVLKKIEIMDPVLRFDLTDESPRKEAPKGKFRLPHWQDALRVEIGNLAVRNADLSLLLPGDVSIHIRGGSSDLAAKQGVASWKWQGSGEIRRGAKSLKLDQVDIAARLSGETIELEQFSLTGIGASINLKGEAYPNASLLLQVRGELAPVESSLLELGVLSKPLDLAGRIGAEGRVRGAWEDLRWSGEFRGDDLGVKERRFPRLAFSFRVKRRLLEAASGEIDFGGGLARFSIGSLSRGKPGTFDLKAESIPYPTIQRAIHPQLQPHLLGPVTVSASGRIGFDPWVLDGSYAVSSAELFLELPPSARPYLPLVFKNVSAEGKMAWLGDQGFVLDPGQVRATGLEGTYRFQFKKGPDTTGEWSARVSDLSAAFDRRAPIHGLGQVGGSLHYKNHDYLAKLQFQMEEIRYVSHGPYRLTGDIVFEKATARFEKFQLLKADESLALDATAPFDEESPIELRGEVSNFNLGLIAAVFSRRYPVLEGFQGKGSGEIELAGRNRSLNGRIAATTGPVQWRGVQFKRAEANLDVERDRFIVQKGLLEDDLSNVSVSGVFGAGEFKSFQIKASKLPLRAVSVPELFQRIATHADADVTFDGAIQDPSTTGSVQFFRQTEQNFDSVGSGRVDGALSKLHWFLSLEEGSAQAQGDIDARTADHFNGEAQFKNFPLKTFFPAADTRSLLTGQVQLSGDLRNSRTWNGQASIQELLAQRGAWNLSLTEPAHVVLENGRLHLEMMNFSGPSTNVQVMGSADLGGKLDLGLEGDVNLGILPLLIPRITFADGGAHVSLRCAGTFENPQVTGRISGENGQIQFQRFPNPIQAIQFQATLAQRRIYVDKITARVGDGDVSATGYVLLASEKGPSTLNLEGTIRRVHLLFPRTLPSSVSGTVSLIGPTARPVLRGDLLIHELIYRESWNWQSKILSFGRVARAAEAPRPEDEHVQFDLSIRSEGASISIRNEVATAQLRTDLRLVGTDQLPGLLGRVEVAEGTVRFLENKFDFTSGFMAFDNPRSLWPAVDFSAKTRVQTTDVFLDVRTEKGETVAYLSSQPPKDETSIISLLTLGVDTDELAAASGQDVGSTAIGGVLSTAVTGQLESNLRRARIVDTFQFVPFFSEDTKTTGIRMVVKKELFPKFRLSYATDLFAGSGGENTMKLEQSFSRHVSLQGSVRDNTGNANNDVDVGLDLEFSFEF